MHPAAITTEQVQAWVAASTLKPASLRKYVRTMKSVLTFAGVEPNPCVGVRYPRQEHEEIHPPGRREVEAIIARCSPMWRFAVEVLAATGLRVGELCALTWGDVDFAEGRIRVSHGKTAAARRWVPVPPPIMDTWQQTPIDNRTGQLFPGATRDKLASALKRACERAGIASYSPHDLRHRYISLLVKQGIPITTISAQVGHTSKALTWDTYGHVLVDE